MGPRKQLTRTSVFSSDWRRRPICGTHTLPHILLPLSLSLFVSLSLSVSIHAYIHAYIHTHIHTYTHTYIHTYINVHTYIHTYIRINVHTHTYIYIHTYMYVYTYIHTYHTRERSLVREQLRRKHVLYLSENKFYIYKRTRSISIREDLVNTLHTYISHRELIREHVLYL
jgi:hypothetical protein